MVQHTVSSREEAASDRLGTIKNANARPRDRELLDGLLYLHGAEWRPLPPWARFFLDLGAQIASYSPKSGPLVVALSLPARAYAAALAASGIVLTRAHLPDDQADTSAHFRMLCHLASQEPNIPVEYIENVKGRLKRTCAELQGVEIRNGVPTLKVLIGTERQGQTTSFIGERIAFKVQLARKSGALGRSRTMKELAFTKRALGDANLADFVFRTQLDCAILGTCSQLNHEITEASFAFRATNGKLEEGHLQDILRACRFLTDSQHFRSEIIPVAHEGRPRAPLTSTPNTVIFDGSIGFLRWRDDWRGVPWLVLLDRTETHFAEAVEAVKSEDMSRVADAKGLQIPPIPPGIEITTFEVAS